MENTDCTGIENSIERLKTDITRITRSCIDNAGDDRIDETRYEGSLQEIAHQYNSILEKYQESTTGKEREKAEKRTGSVIKEDVPGAGSVCNLTE